VSNRIQSQKPQLNSRISGWQNRFIHQLWKIRLNAPGLVIDT